MQLPSIEIIEAFPKANYENPIDVQGHIILISTCILLPITICFVALRTYTRLFISRAFGLDDIFMLVAVVPTVGVATVAILGDLNAGWDRHVWDVPVDQLVLGLKYQMAAIALFGVASTCTKLSLLIFTYRVMSDANDTLRWITLATIAVVTAETFVFVTVVIVTCRYETPLYHFRILNSC